MKLGRSPAPEPAPATRVLVVDDAADTVELIQRNLASHGYRVYTASGAKEALALLEAMPVDLVVTDIRMPGPSGMDLMRDVRARWPGIEIIVITGYATIEGAVEALRVGAWDYLAKPFTQEELLQAVRRVLERSGGLAQAGGAPSLIEFHGLLGRSKAMRSHFDALTEVAAGTGGVLLRGEAGSGREAAARALHALSGARGPFRRVSLDARQPREWEGTGSELGAAGGGTLYLSALDGAHEDALRAAAALLRSRPGEKSRVPARVVASVAADADELARRGVSMGAILRRIQRVVAIPPLRERGEDVVLLARRFLAECAAASGLAARPLAEAAEQAIRSYSWPGNVRELRDLMTQLALSRRTGPIGPGELPGPIASAPGLDTSEEVPLAAAEREHITRVLRRTGGNKSRAAAILGIDRKTLRDKLRSLEGRRRK